MSYVSVSKRFNSLSKRSAASSPLAPASGAAATVAARSSVWLDGVGDYYTYADSASLDLTNGDWAVAMLVKMDFCSSSKIQYFYNHGNTGGTQNVQLYLNGQTWTGTARAAGSATAFTLDGVTQAADGKWYIVGIRRNGSNLEFFRCVQDGTIEVGTPVAMISPGIVTPSGSAYVGTRYDINSTRLASNNIAYLFKCNGTLTNANIQDLAAGKDIITDLGITPQLYTKFQAGSTITDSGSGGNTATKVGTPVMRGGADWAGLPVRIDAACTRGFGRVYPLALGATSADVTYTGTYKGSPTRIEARVVDKTNSQVVGWTKAGSYPAAGQYSVTLKNVPYGYDYTLEVRHEGDSSTTQRTPLPWGVGCVVFGTGQSNMENMKTNSHSRTIDVRKVCLFDMDEWEVGLATYPSGGYRDNRLTNIGAGAGELVYQLQTALAAAGQDMPIMFVNAAWSGSALIGSVGSGAWEDTTGQPWQRFLDAKGLIGNATVLAWFQGEADAGSNKTQSAYETSLPTVVGRMRTAMSKTAAQLPFLCWTLGKKGTTAAGNNWPGIRAAHRNMPSLITNCKPVGGAYDLVLFDDLHYDTASYIRLGDRLAQAILNVLLPATYTTGCNAPEMTTANFAGNLITINFNLNEASGLAMTGTGNITALTVKRSGVAQTISSTAIVGNTLQLVMAAVPQAGDTIEYWNADSVSGTNHLTGTMPVIGDTRGVPVKPTISGIVVA